MSNLETARTVTQIEELQGFLGKVRWHEVHLQGPRLVEYAEPQDKEIATEGPSSKEVKKTLHYIRLCKNQEWLQWTP